MYLHEFQAKALLRLYDINVPRGLVIDSANSAEEYLEQLDGDELVLKVQIHAGGRAKAGGVSKLGKNAITTKLQALLQKPFVTTQNAPQGQMVKQVLIEEKVAIEKEFYLSLVIDRTSQKLSLLASCAGGVEVEEQYNFLKLELSDKVETYQIRQLIEFFALPLKQLGVLYKLVSKLLTIVKTYDLVLLEMNPLALSKQNLLVAVDCKMEVDDNALFRQTNLKLAYDQSQQNKIDTVAKNLGLNYIGLAGNIACMVNGAGLAMATMDLIKHYGGMPANFLDVGGGANKQMLVSAFALMMQEVSIKALFINIFGGIMRCDLIAQSLIEAWQELQFSLPLVVRFQGNKAKEGMQLLAKCHGINIHTEADLARAAKLAVELAG